MVKRLLAILLFAAAVKLSAYTKVGSVYVTDGSQADIALAYTAMVSGEAIGLPPGPITLGTGGWSLSLSKSNITVQGAGPGVTVVTAAANAPSGDAGVFRIYGDSITIENFTWRNSATGNSVSFVNGSGADNFHLSNIEYDGLNRSARFLFGGQLTGLVDYCTFVNAAGEYIFFRGQPDAWSQDFAYFAGQANQIVVERCSFDGTGYTDSNSNGAITYRFNTLLFSIKLDDHGIASNSSPVRGARWSEMYCNLWTYTGGSSWPAIEKRGGGGMVWGNNVLSSNLIKGSFVFTDYCMTGQWAPMNRIYATPFNYPIPDQIGVGPGAVGSQVGGAEPVYFFDNIKGNARANLHNLGFNLLTRTTNDAGYAVGATSITTENNGQPSGNGIYAGNYFTLPGDTTLYRFTSSPGGAMPATFTFTPGLTNPIAAGSKALMTMNMYTTYSGQIDVYGSTFSWQQVIGPDRDYFAQGATFDGSSGVGIGPKSAILAPAGIVGTKVGVGYWATDEGNWNQSVSGTVSVTTIKRWDYVEITSVGTTDFGAMGAPAGYGVGTRFVARNAGTGSGMVKAAQGQFYTWNGSAWALKYVPLVYPHPLSTGYVAPVDTTAPSITSATINAPATTLTVNFNEAAVFGAGGSSGFVPTLTGGASSMTYVSGSGSASWIFSLARSPAYGETGTLAFTQPGNGAEDAAGNDVVTVSGITITNNVPPSGTPVITEQPSALIVTEGEPAEFFVAATTSGGPLTYQWRKGGVNISGATSSSYAIAMTITGDAGSYSVVVTDSNGSTTSATAALTVISAVPPGPSPSLSRGTSRVFTTGGQF